MNTIYELQHRASELRSRTQTGSITPEDVGSLHADTLEYLADMEQSADGLGIRKVYTNTASMNADKEPVGTNGKLLRFGQLVTIYNPAAPTAADKGEIYAWQKPGWKLVGHATPEAVLLALLRGRSSDSNAARDPFVYIGDFVPTADAPDYVAKANAAIDSFFSKDAGEDNQKWCGLLRGSVHGNRFEIRQYAVSYAEGNYVQRASGCLGISPDGRSLTFFKMSYAEYVRVIQGGVAGKWTPFFPQVQHDAQSCSDDKKYIFSTGEKESTQCVLTSAHTKLHQRDGRLFFSKGFWGPTEDDTCRMETVVPVATHTSDGVMSRTDKTDLDRLSQGIVDLGDVSSSSEAYRLASQRNITENLSVRQIHWRSGGDGGTIFQSRYGQWYVTQFIFFEGKTKKCFSRLITTGGNYAVEDWCELLLPVGFSYDAAKRSVSCSGISDALRRELFTIPMASLSNAGLMSAFDKKKLDDQLSKEDLLCRDYLTNEVIVEPDRIIVGSENLYDGTFGENSLNLEGATPESAGLMTATDKRLLAHILDIGDFASKDAACAYAARSEIAGNRQVALIVFKATGSTGKKLEGRIIQMTNGEDVAMQLLLWDKRIYRRNVTGATGVAGGTVNVFQWEETGVQKIKYTPLTRKLQLGSYENGEIASVILPLASSNYAGLFSAAEKDKLAGFSHTSFKIVESDTEVEAISVEFVGTDSSRVKYTFHTATKEHPGLMSRRHVESLERLEKEYHSAPLVTKGIGLAVLLQGLTHESTSDAIKKALGGREDLSEFYSAVRSGRQLVFSGTGSGYGMTIIPVCSECSSTTGGHILKLIFFDSDGNRIRITITCIQGVYAVTERITSQ